MTAAAVLAAAALPCSAVAGKPDHAGKPGHAGKPAKELAPVAPAVEDGAAGEAPEAEAPKPKGKAKGKAKKAPTVTYVLRGTVVSAADGMLVVTVTSGNSHSRKLRGTDVSVAVPAGAKVVVADANGDGRRDLADVAAGDKAKLQVRMPKLAGAVPAEPTATARHLVVAKPAPAPEPTPEPAPEPAPAA